jgi:hypothetical protein
MLNVLLYNIDTHVAKDVAVPWESLALGTQIQNLTVCGSHIEYKPSQGTVITIYAFQNTEIKKPLKRIPV